MKSSKTDRQQKVISNILSEHVDSFFIVATTLDGNMLGYQKFNSVRDKIAIEHCLEQYFMHKIENEEGTLDGEDE